MRLGWPRHRFGGGVRHVFAQGNGQRGPHRGRAPGKRPSRTLHPRPSPSHPDSEVPRRRVYAAPKHCSAVRSDCRRRDSTPEQDAQNWCVTMPRSPGLMCRLCAATSLHAPDLDGRRRVPPKFKSSQVPPVPHKQGVPRKHPINVRFPCSRAGALQKRRDSGRFVHGSAGIVSPDAAATCWLFSCWFWRSRFRGARMLRGLARWLIE